MAPERDPHDRQPTVGSVPHDALVRVEQPAQRVGEAIANRRACDLARGRHGWERQREVPRLEPSIVASEDLVHPLM
jgi:hypothetical protein